MQTSITSFFQGNELIFHSHFSSLFFAVSFYASIQFRIRWFNVWLEKSNKENKSFVWYVFAVINHSCDMYSRWYIIYTRTSWSSSIIAKQLDDDLYISILMVTLKVTAPYWLCTTFFALEGQKTIWLLSKKVLVRSLVKTTTTTLPYPTLPYPTISISTCVDRWCDSNGWTDRVILWHYLISSRGLPLVHLIRVLLSPTVGTTLNTATNG